MRLNMWLSYQVHLLVCIIRLMYHLFGEYVLELYISIFFIFDVDIFQF